MKTVGIVGAMEAEVALLKSRIGIISVRQVAGIEFTLGKLSGKNVVVARCRVGKVNAAVCAQILIDMYGVDYIISTGVAGAIVNLLEIGDVVISSDLAQHDFDMSGIGDARYVNPSLDESFFKADAQLVKLAKGSCDAVLCRNRSYVGRVATGDRLVMSAQDKERIWNDLEGMCVETEGAAIGQVCYLNNIPFVVIRSISDKANGSDGESVNFELYVDVAANISAQVVEEMLNGL
ncbi:MAG: 5'-methylthioadenosine/adenosylhomocysteine nucleosidase [Defluviitaleaceae bacterium]|nr:5'-methylthioadenosine/adenosylhomocysteine nucleosidase [Defluviitaleaceae bacterium]